jgi:hypothetical protein
MKQAEQYPFIPRQQASTELGKDIFAKREQGTQELSKIPKAKANNN